MTPSENAGSLGRELRARRENARLNQAQFAERLGVSQAAVSQWETGVRQPILDDLYRIAAELDCEVSDLLPRRREIRAALRAVAEKLDVVGLGAEADSFLDVAETVDPPAVTLSTRASEPIDATQDLLRQAGVRKPPIDIEAIASGCGVRVIEWPFTSSDLSGLVVETSTGPVIGVHSGHGPQRRRFTIAHELGHAVMRHLDSYHVDLGDASEHGEPPNYDWRQERAANDFAASILMPADFVRELVVDDPSPKILAKKFNVSELAMGFRLVNLGLR
jgi:transcriptional regulator with XRE-family HTH domain